MHRKLVNMLLWVAFCSLLSTSWCLLPFVISSINNDLTIEDFQPQQIHLSIGETSDTVVVTWLTPSETPSSVVKYGTERMNNAVQGALDKFMDGGRQHRIMWIHRVELKNLSPNTKYIYHCGSPLGWSEEFSFTTWKNGTDWPARVVMFGDMGAVNPQSLPRLQEETQLGMYDAVIHVGDFAYNMDSDNARVGDEFMRQIQPIAAYVPYMTCVGNHEFMYNFSNYRARFTMPNYRDTENLFFSWNMGPVHFVAVSTEAYYFMEFGLKPLSRQFQWLINDLEEASKPEARAERPWIIVYGHRPMYCSNSDHDDCRSVNCLTRVGISLLNVYGMEALLDKYGVDIAVWAHEHSYERLWPMYNYTVYNGSMEEPYTNPKAPIHIITGSAGCQERHDHFIPVKPYWSAFRNSDYGYTRLTAYNATHLYFEQVSDDQKGEVIDRIWVIKDQHVPFAELRSQE
ncbi:acid phosphatase type 7-like isoform X2 [Macrobrachium rosenbergii]|uniref:acid phosphatase type 7-like isoform X2 n=1 Tax=Macrobrachium rosenbergii TaxID=79674 RepID=UPI0034D464B8